jgi:threonine dehydrogenase-like Zn-dependent dehydrogenase
MLRQRARHPLQVTAARPEGTVVVVGGGRAGLEPIAIILKELRVLGSFTYAHEFTEVIALLADGALQVAISPRRSQASTRPLSLSSGYATQAL